VRLGSVAGGRVDELAICTCEANNCAAPAQVKLIRLTRPVAVRTVQMVMKARTNSAVAVGALAGGVVVLAFTTVVVLVESAGLRTELTRMRTDAETSRVSREADAAELNGHREALAELRAKVTALQDQSASAPATGPASATPARLVRGNQIVGTGWVMTTTNVATGRSELNVIVENPAQPATQPVSYQPTAASEPVRTHTYAYWYQQPLYTWGTLVGDYLGCTNDLPGFAPSPRPTPVASEPTPPAAVPAPAAPPAMAPRAARTMPLRPAPAPPVVTRPPAYYPTTPSPAARTVAPAKPFVRSSPVVTTARPVPAPTPVRTPVPRIQPLPNRPL
jgi:hypothetical protein